MYRYMKLQRRFHCRSSLGKAWAAEPQTLLFVMWWLTENKLTQSKYVPDHQLPALFALSLSLSLSLLLALSMEIDQFQVMTEGWGPFWEAPPTWNHLQDLCETLCKYHIRYFGWLTARISAAGEQCSHWSLFKLGLFFPLCVLKGCFIHSSSAKNCAIISLKSKNFYVSISIIAK